jgi:hypothetical protein
MKIRASESIDIGIRAINPGIEKARPPGKPKRVL